MTLSSKERAELRAEAHHLTALVHIGHTGSPTRCGRRWTTRCARTSW